MKKYFSLVTFSHTIFAMPFAFIGFFLALTTTSNEFSVTKLLLMLACMVLARNSAMAFNRYIDSQFDEKNPRTQQRDIPSGKISKKEALIFILVNCIGFIICTYFINKLCFYLSPIALFTVLIYSLTKRFTALCHLVLGVGLGLAPIGAYLVVTGYFSLLPILYSFAVMFWVGGFDIIYALQDDEFDKANKLHSIPSILGRENALIVSRFLHVLSFSFIVITTLFVNFTWVYYLAVAFFGVMLFTQQRLVRNQDLSKVNAAFFVTNGIASSVFAVLFLIDAWLRQ